MNDGDLKWRGERVEWGENTNIVPSMYFMHRKSWLRPRRIACQFLSQAVMRPRPSLYFSDHLLVSKQGEYGVTHMK